MLKSLILLLAVFVPSVNELAGLHTIAMQDTVQYTSPFFIRNERCLKCHGEKSFVISDTNGTAIETMIQPGIALSRDAFYSSSHRSFKCTDCHSDDFSVYPHPEEAKDEIQFNCIDCHGGDPAFAKYKFEAIAADYEASVHFGLEEKGFTCWSCHDPHSFRNTYRIAANKSDAIKYDNAMCMNCHSENAVEKHKLFGDAALHFDVVGCVECHTLANDSLMVAHLVTSKEKAYRNCKECHSRHSKAGFLPLPSSPGSNTPGGMIGNSTSQLLHFTTSLIIFTVALFLISFYLHNRLVYLKR